jgi:hypothetical protein
MKYSTVHNYIYFNFLSYELYNTVHIVTNDTVSHSRSELWINSFGYSDIMLGKIEIIWYFFPEFEVKFSNLVCVTCILCVGLVESFKIAFKLHVCLSKLHALATRKLYHLTARSLFVHTCCCKAKLKAMHFGFCGRVYRPVGRTRSVFVVHLTACSDANLQCSGQGLKVRLVSQVFLFFSVKWCVAHP